MSRTVDNKQLIKIKEFELEKPQVIQIGKKDEVHINDVSFDEEILTSIKVIKHHFEDSGEDSLFIEAYIGHKVICTTISKVDYVIRTTQYSSGRMVYYIGPAEDWDY